MANKRRIVLDETRVGQLVKALEGWVPAAKGQRSDPVAKVLTIRDAVGVMLAKAGPTRKHEVSAALCCWRYKPCMGDPECKLNRTSWGPYIGEFTDQYRAIGTDIHGHVGKPSVYAASWKWREGMTCPFYAVPGEGGLLAATVIAYALFGAYL